MKLLALIITMMMVLISPQAMARDAGVLNMSAHCRCVMERGTCAPFNEVRDAIATGSGPSAFALPRVLGVYGLVSERTWFDWNANPQMCDQLVVDCETSPLGDGCRIAKSQFRQDTNFDCADDGLQRQLPRESPSSAAAILAAGLLAIVIAARRRARRQLA
jgi:hypothetical protein